MHAENGDIINWLTSQLESRSLTSPYYHALSRPPIVESEAVNRAIVLSTLVDNPILFVHVSGVEATDVIRKARAEGKSVAGETCPQYLYLTWEDLVSLERLRHDSAYDSPLNKLSSWCSSSETPSPPSYIHQFSTHLLPSSRSHSILSVLSLESAE